MVSMVSALHSSDLEAHVYIRSGSGWKAVHIYHPLDKYHLTLVIAYLSPGQQHLNLTDRSLEIALGKQGSLSLLAAVVGFLSFRIFLCLLQWDTYLHNG